MNPMEIDKYFDNSIEFLLERSRSQRPSLGFFFYEGDSVDPRWIVALSDWGKSRGMFVEHIPLSEMGESPVRVLLGRKKVGDHLFSIEIREKELPDVAWNKWSPLTDLNIHRDTFREKKLSLLLWIPQKWARRFMELAANLFEYRTFTQDLPPFDTEGTSSTADPQSIPPPTTLHNLPFPSLGPMFIGRETELTKLNTILAERKSGAIMDPYALEGQGGIGKTQLAIEFAWRHLQDYQFIFFVRADTPDRLRAEIAGLANEELINLPAAETPIEDEKLKAVLYWLANNESWLLIIDNADSEDSEGYISSTILPALGENGHVLLTTRYRRWGGDIKSLPLEQLPAEEASELLIQSTTGKRRSKLSDPEDVAALAKALDGLPLALEQIASWINETKASFSDALKAVTKETASTLSWYKPGTMSYPVSVAAVWNKVREEFTEDETLFIGIFSNLAPNPVPDFLFQELENCILSRKGKSLDLKTIARKLVDRSVLKRHTTGAFSLHRLWMELERKRIPPEQLPEFLGIALDALANSFNADPGDVRNWSRLELLLPHAETILNNPTVLRWETHKEFISSESLIRLSHEIGNLYLSKAEFKDSEQFLKKALEIGSIIYPPNNPILATILGNLGSLLLTTNRYMEAESLFERSLEIREKHFGPNHSNVAVGLNNLAQLFKVTNKLSKAEPLFKRSLEIQEKTLGPDHYLVAIALNNLAGLLQDTNRLSEAEPLYKRSIKIQEESFGPDHPYVATGLSNLAQLYQDTNRFSEAESLFKKSLEIDEKHFGPDHPQVATDLNNLAQLYQDTNRFSEAEPLIRRSLEIDEKSFGPYHSHVGVGLNNLAQLLQHTKRFSESENLFKRSLEIQEKIFGPEHPNVGFTSNNLANLYMETNRYSEAELLFNRSLKIQETSFGPDHPNVATCLHNIGMLLISTNRKNSAAPFFKRCASILIKFHKLNGYPHPKGKLSIQDFQKLLKSKGNSDTSILAKLMALGSEAGFEEKEFDKILREHYMN